MINFLLLQLYASLASIWYLREKGKAANTS